MLGVLRLRRLAKCNAKNGGEAESGYHLFHGSIPRLSRPNTGYPAAFQSGKTFSTAHLLFLEYVEPERQHCAKPRCVCRMVSVILADFGVQQHGKAVYYSLAEIPSVS